MDNFPCYKCVCIAICRLKHYDHMYNDCDLVSNYINKKIDDSPISIEGDGLKVVYEYRLLLQQVINPVSWRVNEDGRFIKINEWYNR